MQDALIIDSVTQGSAWLWLVFPGEMPEDKLQQLGWALTDSREMNGRMYCRLATTAPDTGRPMMQLAIMYAADTWDDLIPDVEGALRRLLKLGLVVILKAGSISPR